MTLINALIILIVILAISVLTLVTPLLLLVALLTKIFGCLVCTSPKTVVGDVAVVTGAGHGLGRAIAIELAKIGCHIAAVDINIEGAEETVKKINKISTVKAKAYKVNVTNFTEISNLGVNVTRDLGPVTILINNAGILMLRNALDPAPEDVQRMIDVNMTSHFWTKAAFLPTMKKLRKGHIVTISSAAGLLPLPYNSTYTASKFGATGHMKALRMELMMEKQHNIHVCIVMPMFLKTNNEIKEIANTVGLNRFYPLISGEWAARRIVKGMLSGEREIKMPLLVDVLCRNLSVLPIAWQERFFVLFSGKLFRKFCEIRA
ncbi:estradiol 17-beta-dehydrogenase 11 [Drosophila innubila]|uniref:estradiol 17-beta-dehydrogenase 11 n=1 Tax=Drosophila innubila TaxID=198719 RepID=UPI00148C6D5F|nr:estradiol 17-beta-dehydrogenase 11 [Drosophila innubila]